MREPIKPKNEDCCNSGCNPCIFDVYEKQVKLYEAFLNGDEDSEITSENAVSQLEYHNFSVVENIDLFNDHCIILYTNYVSKNKVVWNPGDHFLVKYSSPELNCSRAYTPIKLDNKNCSFAVIVKRCGIVSNYLCDLKIGDTSSWRGPYGNYKISPCFNRIIMIAQGTGIAPFHSIIKSILNDEENITRLILLYCCKDINNILLRNELYSLKSFWNFDYEIFINGNDSASSLKYQEPILFHRFCSEDLLKFSAFSQKDQFLICGSSSFMEEYSSLLSNQNIDKVNIVTF